MWDCLSLRPSFLWEVFLFPLPFWVVLVLLVWCYVSCCMGLWALALTLSLTFAMATLFGRCCFVDWLWGRFGNQPVWKLQEFWKSETLTQLTTQHDRAAARVNTQSQARILGKNGMRRQNQDRNQTHHHQPHQHDHPTHLHHATLPPTHAERPAKAQQGSDDVT